MENKLSIVEIFNFVDSTQHSRCITEGDMVLAANHLIMCGAKTKTDYKIAIYAPCMQSLSVNGDLHEITGLLLMDNKEWKIKEFHCTCKAGGSECCRIFIHGDINLAQESIQSLSEQPCLGHSLLKPLEGEHFVTNADSENSCSSRDGSSSNNGGQWHETQRDHRHDHGKNRDRSRDAEWNRDRTFHSKDRENFKEESKERFSEENPQQHVQQQPTPFPAYVYNTTDHSYVDNSQRAMNLMAAMNNNMQWGVNPMYGMAMTPNNMPVNSNSTTMPIATGMEITPTTSSAMNPYAYMSVPGDSMYGMMGIGNYCHYGMMNSQENVIVGPVRETFHLTLSSLYPPKPTDPAPTTRGRPAGCKTVFVGGLPEKATEEIIKEVFEKCGEIHTIRMSKKNFCHIRFTNEAYVESAICYSGYRMKIENKDDQPYTGRLHVDYAQARDDEYEYKCQQRARKREARLKQRQEEEYYKVPTPPPVVNFSEHEATVLGKKLRGEETFQQAVFVLITWLERGECNKRNAGSFYSMIQSTNSHVRRLMNEKLKYEDELNKTKLMLKKQMQGILLQLNEIMKVFKTASLQKVWDKFTKAQRKNIDLWKKLIEEIKNAHIKEVLNNRIEDEMDLSEDEQEKDEGASEKTSDQKNKSEEELNNLKEELNKLKDENEAIRCQLEASVNKDEGASKETSDTSDQENKSEEELNKLKQELNKLKNENEAIRCQLKAAVNKDEGASKETSDTSDQKNTFEEELNKLKKENETVRLQLEAAVNETAVLKSDMEFKEQHIQRLIEALQNSTKILNQKCVAEEAEFKESRTFKSKRIIDKDDHHDGNKGHYETDNDMCQVSTTSSDANISEREARLMSLISTFLHKHPFGANVGYIYLYLNNIDSSIEPREFQSLIKRFPIIYRKDLTGIVASLGKNRDF